MTDIATQEGWIRDLQRRQRRFTLAFVAIATCGVVEELWEHRPVPDTPPRLTVRDLTVVGEEGQTLATLGGRDAGQLALYSADGGEVVLSADPPSVQLRDGHHQVLLRASEAASVEVSAPEGRAVTLRADRDATRLTVSGGDAAFTVALTSDENRLSFEAPGEPPLRWVRTDRPDRPGATPQPDVGTLLCQRPTPCP